MLIATLVLALAAADTVPCNVPMDDPLGQEWLLKQGDGFTYCVPASWKPVGKAPKKWDQVEWRSGRSWIRWANGQMKVDRKVVTVSAVVPASELNRPNPDLYGGVPVQPPATMTFTETIGDKEVVLWNNPVGTTRRTGAAWTDPGFNFSGEAADVAASAVEMSVYRTVRVSH